MKCHFTFTDTKSLQSCPSLCDLWTVIHQAPLSMGFSRQDYWSGLPSPPPGNLPDPGIESESFMSPAMAGRFFTTIGTWKALTFTRIAINLKDRRTSLVVQILRLPCFYCREHGLLPNQGSRMPHGVAKKKKKIISSR